MGFYYRHVFFCTNQRRDGSPCCAQHNSSEARKFAKDYLKKCGEHGPGRIRINQSGCLGRCEEGPILVIYPEGVWYTYDDIDDIRELIERHLLGDKTVDRLMLSTSVR